MTDRPRSIQSGERQHGSEGLTGSFGGGSRLGASVAGGRGVFRWSLREEYERLGLHQAPGLQRVANQVRRSRRRTRQQQQRQLASQRPGILVILTTALSEDGHASLRRPPYSSHPPPPRRRRQSGQSTPALCESYPEELYVPAGLTLGELLRVCDYRSLRRLPAVTWADRRTYVLRLG